MQAINAEVGELHGADARAALTGNKECGSRGFFSLGIYWQINLDPAAAGPQFMQIRPFFFRTVEADGGRGEAMSGTVDVQEADINDYLGTQPVIIGWQVDGSSGLAAIIGISAVQDFAHVAERITNGLGHHIVVVAIRRDSFIYMRRLLACTVPGVIPPICWTV